MGTCVLVLPNVYDYWIQITNPKEEFLEVAEQHEVEVIREIKMDQQEKWENYKISAVLLEDLIKSDKRVSKMIEESKKGEWFIVDTCSEKQTLSPYLYEQFSSRCKLLKARPLATQLQQLLSQDNLFQFQTTGTVLDLHSALACSSQTRSAQELPSQYLLLEMTETYNIYVVKGKEQKLVFRSPFNEKLVIQMIKKVQERVCRDDLNYTLQVVLQQIFQKGDYGKADLLVQDIFGRQNCQFIGLPPKLIASSLAKYSKQPQAALSQPQDHLQSLLVAFAINIAVHAKEHIWLQQITKVVFKTNQINHKGFLSIINTMLAPYAQVIFAKKGNLPITGISNFLKEQGKGLKSLGSL